MRYFVQHGGLGPCPGSDEARDNGCTCPGDVGDPDRWGRLGGFTVDNHCTLHGKAARAEANRQWRKEWRQNMADLEQEAHNDL